jgi:hypothetical protein
MRAPRLLASTRTTGGSRFAGWPELSRRLMAGAALAIPSQVTGPAEQRRPRSGGRRPGPSRDTTMGSAGSTESSQSRSWSECDVSRDAAWKQGPAPAAVAAFQAEPTYSPSSGGPQPWAGVAPTDDMARAPKSDTAARRPGERITPRIMGRE